MASMRVEDQEELALPVDLGTAGDVRVARRPGLATISSAPQTRRARGWLVRRLLLAADLGGLLFAFVAADAIASALGMPVDIKREAALFFPTLPVWVVIAKIYGLYDRDEERANHSTIDEIVSVFHLLTVGVWLFVAATWTLGVEGAPRRKVLFFWLAAVVAVPLVRSAARRFARTRTSYLQNAIILGAGDVGQLVARKLLQHPEYGIRLVGFVDANPRELREDVRDFPVIGEPAELASIVEREHVERIIVAYSNDSSAVLLAAIRSLNDLNVQVDIVPRLFEVIAPNVDIRLVEGLPLVGLPALKLSRSSRLLKRGVDVIGSVIGLVISAPLFAYAAWRIRRESPGPVFFRQERVGLNMRRFTVLKFRTMRVGVDESAHRAYIQATMDNRVARNGNGLYKLERDADITRFGRWLRKTSLDELPQLLNVLRGEMSLVGPRPCIPYELDNFAAHHFERFLTRPGLTGLWQVTSRARSTFGEALDMDVAYVRGWSFGLDLALICRTPVQLLRSGETA